MVCAGRFTNHNIRLCGFLLEKGAVVKVPDNSLCAWVGLFDGIGFVLCPDEASVCPIRMLLVDDGECVASNVAGNTSAVAKRSVINNKYPH